MGYSESAVRISVRIRVRFITVVCLAMQTSVNYMRISVQPSYNSSSHLALQMPATQRYETNQHARSNLVPPSGKIKKVLNVFLRMLERFKLPFV